jgi:MSHA biogenesis protein MshQ
MLFVGCGTPDPALATADASVPDAFEPTPPAGIVAWLSFDASDDPIRNRYQVAFGGPFFSAYGPGYRGRGITMDGVEQYALVTDYDAMKFTGPFTIAAWVRADRVPSDFETIVSRSYGDQDELSLGLFIDSALHLRYVSQGGASLATTTALTVGESTHVALSYDGTTKRVYVNDALAGTETAPVPVTWDDHPFFFGADEGASITLANDHLLGVIDEIMFFDRALDATELVGL